ncbi:Nacht domain protein [Rutstroemia sp. NJR-2017a WRK4]|nr:Nacht domain protein [Rutstroemia sp. NJR-2017a WRK4]
MYPLLLLYQGVAGLPLLQNVTIPLPNGTSNHGTPGLLCTPATWVDIVTFYLVNYAAHAVTTRSLLGEKTYSFAITVMMALLFPAAGAFRGMLGIASPAVFRTSDLETAASAGALCMVIRTPEWESQNHDQLQNTILHLPLSKSSSKNHMVDNGRIVVQSTATSQEENSVGISTTRSTQSTTRLAMYDSPWRNAELFEDDISESNLHIHGSYKLPSGYTLSRVPGQAKFITDGDPGTGNSYDARLSYSYNQAKILISLGQAIYAIFTLYQARGD